MNVIVLAGALMCVFAGAAYAQGAGPTDPNMKCSDYIALEKQMGTYGVATGDAAADALEKKIADYCKANPSAPVMPFIQKAMGG